MLERPELPTVSTGSAKRPATLAFLGPPPLVAGEHPAAYDELLARVSGALKPADILEEIWIRDVVDLVWQAFRLRRLKAHLMTALARDGVKSALRLALTDSHELFRRWAAGDEAARTAVEATLTAAGETVEGVVAEKVSSDIGDLERIDRMIMAAEARRNLALRELDRHRATLAQTLRRAIADVEDAEFEVVTPEKPAHEVAA